MSRERYASFELRELSKKAKTKLVERLLRKILNNKRHVQGTLKFSSLVIIRFL